MLTNSCCHEPQRHCSQYTTKIEPNDVLLGRGSPIVNNEGNRRFRKLIVENKPAYTASGKHAVKDEIAKRILHTIAERGGRFLRKMEDRERIQFGITEGISAWIVVNDEEVRVQKIKQALREQETIKADAGRVLSAKPRRKRKAATSPFKSSVTSGSGSHQKDAGKSQNPIKAPVVELISPPLLVGHTRIAHQVQSNEDDAKRNRNNEPERHPENLADDDDDLQFRLKHPSWRKKDLMRLRRRRQQNKRP